MRPYIDSVVADIEWTVQESRALLDQAERVPEGWKTPNGALFLPALEHFERDKQIMTVPISYRSSAAFFRSALDARVIAIVTSILGPDVELQKNGQCLYKEPVGGHPKHLHQDSAYFEHKFEGPVGVLTYGVPTDLVNGALLVVPGSHRLGQLRAYRHFFAPRTGWFGMALGAGAAYLWPGRRLDILQCENDTWVKGKQFP